MSIHKLITLRKQLHKNPEVSGEEYYTTRRIKAFLEQHGSPKISEAIGGTGLAAVYEYGADGPSITIRCELDALPIQEINTFRHKSIVDGISHKCGHDGHMAIVCGLAPWLKKQTFRCGKVILLFQPAEENGKGAYRVINDEKFKALKTDYIFALHNIPKAPLHQIISIQQGFSAEVQSLAITLKGKESHAAEPEHGINPALAISALISKISKWNRPNPEVEDFALLTPVHLNLGQKAYGISAGHGELHYTLRTWSGQQMSLLKKKTEQLINKTCQAHKLSHEVKWLEYFPASVNNAACVKHIDQAAKENSYTVEKRAYPFKFGEDFGWFTRDYKAAMFGLGAGLKTPALHNPDYDFPDEIIETGVDIFKSIILDILKEKMDDL